MSNNQPIGLFDSGVGGTSIWTAIQELLPAENTIYLADSANAPYGLRSKEEIIALSKKNTELLLQMGAKAIVVACNTATTNAIRELRAAYDIPFIGIEPAIKPAATQSKTQTIGILATKGTLSSELFNKSLEQYPDTTVIEQVGHGLVELIEGGKIDSDEMTEKLLQYLQPMLEANIDYLVLGCSHYPYLIPQLQKLLPETVVIIDSGEAVARQTKAILESVGLNDGLHKAQYEFYTNGDPAILDDILKHRYKAVYRDF